MWLHFLKQLVARKPPGVTTRRLGLVSPVSSAASNTLPIEVPPDSYRSRLLEELGEPFGRLWAMLTQRYSEREAARLLSRLLGAMVDHGETTIAEVIDEALARGDLDRVVCCPSFLRRRRGRR